MKEVIKYYISHFKKFIVFIPLSIFLLLISVIKTNNSVTLKGDTTKFMNVVTVENGYETKGSFNTIYVTSYEGATPFMTFIVNQLDDAEVYETSASSQNYTLTERYTAGKIQYQSGLSNSLVLAYTKAKETDSNISINYHFDSFYITGYGVDSAFRINDKIVKIKASSNGNKEVSYEDESVFRYVINHRTYGDIYTVERDYKEIEIVLTENDTFSAYSIYKIDEMQPKATIHSENVIGPSGGFLQTLSTYNQLVSLDLTHGLNICGTGTIAYNGTVGIIGGIKEKIFTAAKDNMDIFFCPKDNYEEAKEAYNKLVNPSMKLIMIETFDDAIKYLTEGYKDDFR